MMDLDYIERYKRPNSSNFTRASFFEEGKFWLTETEKVFATLGVVSKHKVILATYMLVGEADCWWQLKQATLPVSVT